MFRGLSNLIRLNLSGNLFSTLSQGTFESLQSLKYIEFQTDYLMCDCNLLWMIQWIKARNITVRETKCPYPKSLQQQLVTSVRKELLTCDTPLELPSFQLTPSHRQVVFEGDSLPFQCMASYIDQDMQVLWYQDGKIVETDESQGILVEKNMIHNCSLIASALTISNIQMGSTGNWECRVRTKRGNNTKQVDIVVLESSAQYCPPERVMNNKGNFRWPRTLAGITAYLLCTRYSAGTGIYPGSSQDERKVWRKCDRGGFWAEDDYSRCQYANDVTRVLYMFNQMPLNLTNAVATARQLLAYTVEAANFSDKMDVLFVAEMIEKFGRFTEKYKELGDVMVDIASNIMLADEHVLWMAQREAKACTRIVQCLQRIPTYRLDLNGADFELRSIDLLHPVVYVTAAVLLICLFIIIASYIYHHSAVRISRKSWHMLVNLCFHIFLTCAVFVGGINQTRNISVCQAVGIILHYSTLSTILWVGVTARNIFKQLTRKAKRCQDPDEPPPPPRPMLRFYLIGGGIPIIVCGITAAANIKNYGSEVNAPYCWMAWEPSLGAFYGPVGFIFFVNCIYFLSIFVQHKQHPERKYELKETTEEQQRLASIEHGDSHLNDSMSTSQANCSVVSSSALENEHTFQAQLIGASLALFMYAVLWVSGALAVSQYYPLDLIFSCLFGATALSLGAFLVLHHCIGREDVRRCWMATCCPGRSTYSMQVNVQPPGASLTNGEAPKFANSSGESSTTNKTASSNNKLSQGCKLTNLHAAAVQNQINPVASNISTQLDNSLTEHSMDNDLKMHVAPVEVAYRPNGQVNRHHKNRTRAHQAHRHSRLAVLREYAYDVPTSVEGSVHNGQPKSRHSNHESHHGSRRSRSALRERHYSHSQLDNSDVSYTLTHCNRNVEKDGVSSSKDSLQQPIMVELENQKSYGLNLATQNGLLKGSSQDAPLLNADSTGNIRTGFWRNETTV
uniref:Adhesion G protein-coupled receptor A3 n=1 Tax=Callorhinchus milii TaxID=7868 RepID=A0A4W3I1H6_CALMI